ncbi:hypothetical protein LRS13_13585 [Svornostia abyssi]|uniref:DUF541 domain-containing protein n=1 Tax=Svornostia abyssi TaxID=2898438 RepID=A0ABY5PAP5_9ACTN|nr:hypothetical protein LRS13_13585 [Parviterribacteraceae bacterium J379]
MLRRKTYAAVAAAALITALSGAPAQGAVTTYTVVGGETRLTMADDLTAALAAREVAVSPLAPASGTAPVVLPVTAGRVRDDGLAGLAHRGGVRLASAEYGTAIRKLTVVASGERVYLAASVDRRPAEDAQERYDAARTRYARVRARAGAGPRLRAARRELRRARRGLGPKPARVRLGRLDRVQTSVEAPFVAGTADVVLTERATAVLNRELAVDALRPGMRFGALETRFELS